jgi:hypothetical protein
MKNEGATYQSNDLFTTVVLVLFPLYFLLKIVLVSSYTYSVYLLNNFISSSTELARAEFVSSLNFSDGLSLYNIILFILCAVSFSISLSLSLLAIQGRG